MGDSGHDPAKSRTRSQGIDAGRYVLAFAVVLLHSIGSAIVPVESTLVKIACRVAVPFFFITSGYFMKTGSKPDIGIVLKPLRRLLPIYFFWLLVYYLFVRLALKQPWHFGLHDLLTGGAAYHLWFLPALGFGLVFVGLALALFGSTTTGVVCAALSAWSLTAGGYYDLIHHGSPGRGGLYVAPMFVYLGTLMARRAVTLGWAWLLGMVAGSYVLLVLEELLVSRWSGAPFGSHDFMLSTFLFATSAFLLVRSLRDTTPLRRAASLGKVSLSVYAAHLLFLWLLQPLIGRGNLRLASLVALMAFVLATILSLILLRIPGLRQFVS